MNLARSSFISCVVLTALLPSPPAARAEPLAAALLELHTSEASGYRIFRDEAHAHELELRSKPIFSWTNLVGEHPQ